MQGSEPKQQSASWPLAEEDAETTELALKIEEELNENPVVLERLLSRPQFRAIISQQSFRGPLPPPAMLREYNEIVENGAERIRAKGEKEQAHRHLKKMITNIKNQPAKAGFFLMAFRGFQDLKLIQTLLCFIFGAFLSQPVTYTKISNKT